MTLPIIETYSDYARSIVWAEEPDKGETEKPVDTKDGHGEDHLICPGSTSSLTYASSLVFTEGDKSITEADYRSKIVPPPEV